MKTIIVKPVNPAIKVPNPENAYLPLLAEGEAVMDSRYWHNRAKEGDVEIVTAKAKPSKKTAGE